MAYFGENLTYIPILIVGFAAAIAFVIFPVSAITWYLLLKPLADVASGLMGGVTTLALGVAFPCVTFFYSLIYGQSYISAYLKFMVGLLITLYALAFIRLGPYDLESLSLYLRAVLPALLFFAIPAIIRNKQDIERLIFFSALSGLVASSLIIIQFLGLAELDLGGKKDLLMIGGQGVVRYTGGFYDAFTASLPILVSIFCLLYLLQRDRKLVYFLVLAWEVGALFLTMHRMSSIVLVVVLSFWIVLNKRWAIGILAIIFVVVALPFLLYFIPNFFGDVDLLAGNHSSVIANKGIEFSSQALHGRGWLWESYLSQFADASIFERMFGLITTGRGPHNDYLRILLNLGFFGLLVYLMTLALILAKLLKVFAGARRIGNEYLEQLALTAIFFWIFLVLSSMTLAVGLLSTLMWYFWMFTGFTFSQDQLEKLRSPSQGVNRS